MIVHDRGRRVETPVGPERADSGPTWLPVIPDAIPRELTDTPSWYLGLIRPKATTVGSWDKIPADARTGQPARWSDPTTRQTFSDAFMAYEAGRGQCVGYMLDAAAGLIGIDLDKCVSPDGSIASWALEIVQQFDGAYWERSISGTGLRGFCRGTLPVGGCRSKIEGCSVELYADQRFLVVTGQALHRVEQLPTLQSAVDALHARLTAGRVRATGTANSSGLTGRTDIPSPEVFAIVQAAMSGRHGERMLDIWSREDLHVSGASEEDWALACELAYQAIQLGYADTQLHRMVEEAMRAGPYRAKWDERRGSVTWLAQDVANATATVQQRLKERPSGGGPTVVWDDHETDAPAPPADETWPQLVARLERELARERGIRAQQQTVIRAALAAQEQAEAGKRAADELVKAIYITLAIPDEQLAARPKLVSLALAREAASRNSRGIFTLSNGALAQLTGLTENVVSQIMQDLAARDGTPFERLVTREYVEIAPGISEPRSIAQVRITTPDQTTLSVIRALPAIGGPSTKEQQRLAKARAKTAAYAEAKIRAEVGKQIGWGWCSTHDNESVTIKGFCPDCGEVVGERRMTVEEFGILNPEIQDSGWITLKNRRRSRGRTRGDAARSSPKLLNPEFRDSGARRTPLVSGLPYGTVFQDSGLVTNSAPGGNPDGVSEHAVPAGLPGGLGRESRAPQD